MVDNETLRLLFRCKVAPCVSKKLMDDMLAELDFAMTYLDDIIIKSKTFE